ncbi:MAG: dihydrofolate reductase [Betaproteobacteria bacterium]|nr:dihydrofolate reductase [Betaproteobacteria bacterium]
MTATQGFNAEPGTRNPKHETRDAKAFRISIIVAMAKNRVIGANNAIPWHLPGELKRFRSVTMGHHIVMGRRTYESIGRLLPGRITVIVTRTPGYAAPGAIVAASLDAAIAACGNDDEIFVIGGAQLYAAALPIADRLYLTTVNAEVAGDTYMPDFNPGAWREVSAQSFAADDKNPYAYRFSIHDRIKR